ncbi:helix-turn-helix domain-containing protein [Actinoplanes sp. NPDC026670]|uniref:TetR/AcrR family transcriptional regulator n=1 Tax=Actinoplanes sp. NPDC026670 TaxID=3154700 RepID=UPI003403158D
MSPNQQLAEKSSIKAARVLAAAGELLLTRGSRGVTIADVAQRAHIGKGTVYLYWKTKEDLLIDLIGGDFLALADRVMAAVTADPDLARPSRLCVNVLSTAADHPFVSALQHHDDLLGVLAHDPRSADLLDQLGPDSMLHTALPLWRANGMARTDWDPAEQTFALHSIITGFLETTRRRPSRPAVVDPEAVLAATVTALLGPDQATPEQVRATAAEGIRLLGEARTTALSILRHPELL